MTEAEEIARLFHETYERLAPDFGYETREASAKPWGEVPENNRKLMIAVAGEVLATLQGSAALPSEAINESGWLIEDNSNGIHTLYMAMSDGGFGPTKRKSIGTFKFDQYETPLMFVKDANEALRFGRQEDAEAFVRVFKRFMLVPKVREHCWPAMRATTLTAPVQDDDADPLHDNSPLQTRRNFVEQWRRILDGDGHEMIANRNTICRFIHIIDDLASRLSPTPETDQQCSFCEAPAACMVSDSNDVFDACPRCWAAWQRDPGFGFEFSRDKAEAFIALVETVGGYIYNNNGAKVLPLKKAWNAAFPYAKAASSAIEAAKAGETVKIGSTEGESAVGATGAETPDTDSTPETGLVEALRRIERLNDLMRDIQMNAHKWMVAHDRLKAGKPYDLPAPADLPEALRLLKEARHWLYFHHEAHDLADAIDRFLSNVLPDEVGGQALEPTPSAR